MEIEIESDGMMEKGTFENLFDVFNRMSHSKESARTAGCVREEKMNCESKKNRGSALPSSV
jgi:hypothetical protein